MVSRVFKFLKKSFVGDNSGIARAQDRALLLSGIQVIGNRWHCFWLVSSVSLGLATLGSTQSAIALSDELSQIELPSPSYTHVVQPPQAVPPAWVETVSTTLDWSNTADHLKWLWLATEPRDIVHEVILISTWWIKIRACCPECLCPLTFEAV